MKLLRWAITKAPKVVLAACIVLTTTAIFLLWLVMRGNGVSGNGSALGGWTPAPEFKADEVVLCGGSLLQLNSGEILSKQWLQGLSDTAPSIVKVLPAEKLVVCGNRGLVQCFGFDGKAKGELTYEGKRLGPAGFSFGDSRVLFLRDSNIWLGQVDWMKSNVVDAKQITSTNYFREDSFRGDFFWTGDILFIPILGRTHRVDLATGEVSQESVNVGQIRQGASPDGRLSAVALGRGNFVLVDFVGGSAKPFSIRGASRECGWLDAKRFACVNNRNEISMLDSTTGKVTAYTAPATVLKIAAVSPQGNSILVGTAKGPMILSIASGDFIPVNLSMDHGIWISERAMLCTTSNTDTAFRGIWRVNADGSRLRVTNQPTDSVQSSTGARPMLAAPGGAMWVSGGDLWRYDAESEAVNQVTQGQHLNSSLQLLQ